jgi:hypothetical protein
METDRNLDTRGIHCFHTVCIGPAEGNGYVQDQRVPNGFVKDQYEFQTLLDDIHSKNNMTIYCHPEWSNTSAREFENMKGNFAMEIWNSGCAIEDDMDTDAAYWDEILRSGKRIWGVATDDGHAMNQHCNGWVVVNAQPDIPSILAALNDGAFYSSCGPEIKDFYIDGDRVVVECSPAAKIRLHRSFMPTAVKRSEDGSLVRAEFTINRSIESYIRVSVGDKEGRLAWSNPIYLD